MQNKKINKIILTLSCALLCLGVFGIKEDKKIYADEWTPVEITPWVITSLATAMGYRIITSGLNSASSINSFIQDKWNTFKQTLTTTGLVLYSATLGSAKLKADNIANGQIIDFMEWLKSNDYTSDEVDVIYYKGQQLSQYTMNINNRILNTSDEFGIVPYFYDTYNGQPVYLLIKKYVTSQPTTFDIYCQPYKTTNNGFALMYISKTDIGSRFDTRAIRYSNGAYGGFSTSQTRITKYTISGVNYWVGVISMTTIYDTTWLEDLPIYSDFSTGYLTTAKAEFAIDGTMSDSFPQRKEVEWELKDEVIKGDTTIDQIKDIINNGVISNTLADIITLTGQIADDIGAQTGLLTDIKEGISELVSTFENIWAIDNDYITTSINNTLTDLQSHTGLLTYPVSLTIEFLNMCNNISANDFILTFPSLPIIENEEKTFNVSAMVRNNNSLNTFYNTYVTILDGIIAFWLVNLLWRKSKEIFKA